MDQPVSQSTIDRRRHLRFGAGAADIRVAEVHRGAIANTIIAAGVVIPVHEELVSSPFQTHVAMGHAKLGQQVKAGELLLQLDDAAIRLALDGVKEQLAQQDNRILGLR